MKGMLKTSLAALALAVTASASVSTAPLDKVVTLLKELESKGKKDLHAEKVANSQFVQWCKGATAESQKVIKSAKGKLQGLSADIKKAQSDAEEFTANLATLEKNRALKSAELANATTVRTKEAADLAAEAKSLTEAIAAIGKAITELKGVKDVKSKTSLLQVASVDKLPVHARATITAFLALDQAPVNPNEPKMAYKSQSGNIQKMLEKLDKQFRAESRKKQKAILKSKLDFERLSSRLKKEIKTYADDIAQKTEAKSARVQSAEKNKAALVSLKDSLNAEQKKLSETTKSCTDRAQEFKENQQVRKEELKALTQAREIIQGSTVAAGAKQLAFLQLSSASAFAQLRAKQNVELSRKLEALAQKTGVQALSLVAALATADKLAKVRETIQAMIARVKKGEDEDKELKKYCEKELGVNKKAREETSAALQLTTASIEKAKADTKITKKEQEQISATIVELRKQLNKAEQMRKKEKAQNAKSIEEAKAAQEAVSKAVQVLKAFYAKTGAAPAAFVQTSEGAPYKGNIAGSGGVLQLLDKILTDFGKVQATTASNEDQAEKDFESLVDKTKSDIAMKEQDIKEKEEGKTQLKKKLNELVNELAANQKEMEGVKTVYEKLKPQCVVTPEEQARRDKAKKDEIASLEEALKMLQP